MLNSYTLKFKLNLNSYTLKFNNVNQIIKIDGHYFVFSNSSDNYSNWEEDILIEVDKTVEAITNTELTEYFRCWQKCSEPK